MRAPSDMPRREPRARGRGRTFLIVGVIVLFVLITSLRGIASFYTDYLWFDSLGQGRVWSGIVGARLVLAALFTGVFFIVMYVNLAVADRIAPAFRPAGPEEELLERYHDLIGPRARLVRFGVALFFALVAGAPVASEWRRWVLFTHARDFGIEDAQFGRDIGFFVFELPFLSYATSWLFAVLVIVLIITGVAHYLNGGIRVQAPRQRVTPQVKAHLSVLLALIALVKAVDYYFQRFELSVSTRGHVDGPSYTDVHAQLPALNLLLLISFAAVVLLIVNIWRRGWALPTVAVGLWALIAVIVGGIYPQFVQRVQVQPNEDTRERPYIERNIAATREALGLQVEERRLSPTTDKSDVRLADDADLIRNIRLWDPDPRVSGSSFQQLQGIRDYYRLNDVDVDRYVVDDELSQVLISVRDLREDGIPQDSWVANHITYTHGYGVALAPTTASNSSDEPDFLVRDIPARSTDPAVELENPRVYFGEGLGGYVVIDEDDERELDYQDEDATRRVAYDGEDGVAVSSFVRRAAFALRFGDVNPLISKSVTNDSRILMMRDVRDRAEALAPFLHFDNDPYPVILDGRIVWVLDAYTTTDRYPYAQRADTTQLDSSSGLDHRFNYVRNSVKAVVDAYDGTVDLYVMPVDDPIIEAYRDAFPSLFRDFDEMPADLRAHLRYPEDLFRVQTAAWARYHLDDPGDFYNRNDGWVVSIDPGRGGATTSTSSSTTIAGEEPRNSTRTDPYYQLIELPGEDGLEFVLLRPFSPFSTDDGRQQLTSFMVARSDPESYGELIAYTMPPGDLPDGPGIVANSIRSNPEVGRLETDLGLEGSGSEVVYGNLIFVPVDEALLWVRPFYVQAEDRQVPLLRKVIVAFGDEVVIEDTLGEALEAIFGESVRTPDQTSPGDPSEPDQPDEPTAPDETDAERAARLLAEAEALFEQAAEALANGDLGTYQDRVDDAAAKVAEAADLIDADGEADDEPTTSTTERATA